MNTSTTINAASIRDRRITFWSINLALFGLGAIAMAAHLLKSGWSMLGVPVFVLFVILLGQVVYGFSLAITGWWILRKGPDPLGLNQSCPATESVDSLPPIAIIMPICNEEISRVFRGLEIMYESLQKTNHGAHFDFFILSDTGDPNHWIAEEKAWFDLCRKVNGFGRIFYRKRRVSVHHKSGNVADFCRRWGAQYRYMIVLDADSLMTGESFIRLGTLMEKNPRIGIIQTCPQLVLGETLFQRVAQFAMKVYGPIFSAGANYWQMSSGNFWGHNAIIRLKPFMEHCAMPDLPKTGPLGKHILSHDTIEAAFMSRAGYAVWVVPDLEGSYEEGPPNLIANLQRDRRWCHGNMQHLWPLGDRGLRKISRFHIVNGIMSYGSSFLWLAFMLLSFVFAPARDSAAQGGGTFLYVSVVFLLLGPKFLGASLLLGSEEKLKCFGGGLKLMASVLCETLLSILIAPILMMYYVRFIWSSFTGTEVKWGGQHRGHGDGPGWAEIISISFHCMLIASMAAIWVAWRAPSYLPALSPVLIGPILMAPLIRFTSGKKLGFSARRRQLFLIPEEVSPPTMLKQIEEPFASGPGSFFQSEEYAGDYGLLQATLDPYLNAIHISLLRQRPQVSIRTRFYLTALSDRLLLDGPMALTPREKRMLLWDADSMQTLHHKLWCSPASHLHEWWQAAFRRYNETSALSVRRTVNA